MSLELLAILVSSFTALVLLSSVYINYKSLKAQHVLKEMDVVMRFQDKYNRLVYELAPTWPTVEENKFCAHYWMLQNDQFLYWQRQWISDDAFLHWLEHRYINFLKNVEFNIGGIQKDYEEIWMIAKTYLKDIAFINLVESIQKRASNGGHFDHNYFNKVIKSLPKTTFSGDGR